MAKKKLKDKRRVYEFWLAHRIWSYAAIGRMFHVTRERVRVIINEFKEEQC